MKACHNDLVHEALDRTCIASSHLQMALKDHPITKKYRDVHAAYEKAVEVVEELYQRIGGKFEGGK